MLDILNMDPRKGCSSASGRIGYFSRDLSNESFSSGSMIGSNNNNDLDEESQEILMGKVNHIVKDVSIRIIKPCLFILKSL